ncbi:MAG: AraC family transcriptional regulator [Acidobacteriota bacterium]|nr:AraC family transcriptional regulator [Acidobacteriota bacterium]
MLLRHESFRRLCHARDRLVEVHDDPLTVERVAREAGISPFHFIRQFEAVFGATPHQFRIQSRLDRARLLLAAGQHSVTDVCMAVGFSSLGSFSSLFSQRLGESPSAYQKRIRVSVAGSGTTPGALPPVLVPGCLSLMAHLPASAFRSFREASLTAVD